MISLSRWAFPAVAAVIVTAHFAMLIDGAAQNFIVVDEAAHVPAGIAQWREARFDIYCVNPPLTRMIATLPALALNPALNLEKAPVALATGRSGISREFPGSNPKRFLTIFRLAAGRGSPFQSWVRY